MPKDVIPPNAGKTLNTIRDLEWTVTRWGKLEEVELPGGSIRFRVQIGDAGRLPFVTQWFNDISPAEDFLSRVKDENESGK